jgi:hypothetical protein
MRMILTFPVSCWALAGIIKHKLKRETKKKVARTAILPVWKCRPGGDFKQLWFMVQIVKRSPCSNKQKVLEINISISQL